LGIETPAVKLLREGSIGVIRLERAHGNAINGALVEDLVGVLAEAEADPAIHGVLLTSAGKIFCPGLDLQELLPLDREAMERFMMRFSAAVLSLYAFQKPVVASIHGHSLAGGCVLALCTDWRVLRRGAITGLNEVKVGVPLPFGVALIVREAVVKNKLTAVALLGRNLADEEAVAAGLADELADAQSVEALARERLDEFIAKDAFSFAVTKRYLRSPVVERIRANNRLLLPEWLDGWFSEGTRARIAAIVAELKDKGKAK
jgi:enoyl-CoA hydratase/carnithine racemase